MAWDWEANDIDVDENDRKPWVPMTPQMMTIAETPRPGRAGPPMLPTMLPQQIAVYTLQLS